MSVERVAETVLYEGYLLFPYTSTTTKNQQRWTFGGVYPRGGGEPSEQQTQCLVKGASAVDIKVRFLQVVDVDGREQAVERQVCAGAALDELLAGVRTYAICEPAAGLVEVSAQPAGADLHRLNVRILNMAEWGAATRPEALRRTFVSTHTILRVPDGEFVSLLDPPEELRGAADACRNTGTWPVLVDDTRTMLSSPIILYDYPEISPQSPGDFFDTTEIDELLTLSVLALTDEEKRNLREVDPRGRELLERTEALSPEQILELHGVMRELR